MSLIHTIPFKWAVNITLLSLVLITLFNFSVLLGWVPFDMVWGGRLESQEQMIRFEIVSISLNCLSMALVMAKAGIGFTSGIRWVNWLVWMLPILNFLGIIGNSLSNSHAERQLFVPTTIILFVLTLRIALEKNNQ